LSEITPRLLSTTQAAKYLSLSRWTVNRLINTGDLPAIRQFKHLRVDRTDLDSFIERAKTN
jgi:excisionase family DNA binding protein